MKKKEMELNENELTDVNGGVCTAGVVAGGLMSAAGIAVGIAGMITKDETMQIVGGAVGTAGSAIAGASLLAGGSKPAASAPASDAASVSSSFSQSSIALSERSSFSNGLNTGMIV